MKWNRLAQGAFKDISVLSQEDDPKGFYLGGEKQKYFFTFLKKMH